MARYDIKLSIGFCLFRLPFVSTLFFVTHCCCALSLRLGLVSPFPSSSSTSFPTQTNPPWLSFHNLLSWIFNFLHFSPFFSLLFSSICDGYYCKGWWESLTLPVIFFTWVRGRKFHLHVPQYVSIYLSHGYLENALVLSRSHSHFVRNCLIITRLYYMYMLSFPLFPYFAVI